MDDPIELTESFLAEPSGVEIRIAAVQAAATVYEGAGSYADSGAIITLANALEQHILAAPSL